MESGVAKVDVEKTVPGAKPMLFELGVRSNQTFKAGVNYRLTFTLKSNQEAHVRYFVRTQEKPFKSISDVFAVSDLPADKPQTLVLRFSVKENTVVPTRLPSIMVALNEGQTLELSDVKLAEEKTPE